MFVVSRFENALKVKPEIAEDLWHLEKLIAPGDRVSGKSERKFVSAGGRQERKDITVILDVEKVEFHKSSGKLKVLGTIIGGRPEEFIQLRQHHSLDVDLFDVVTIEKPEGWKKHEMERLREAHEAAKRPKVFVLAIDEREAEFFVIRELGVDSLGRIELQGGGKQYAE